MTEKECFKCKRVLPLSSFYRHKQMSDGHIGKCKECAKCDARKNRDKNLDYYRDYDRKRGNRQDPSYLKEYRERYPVKYKAHNLVNNAIRAGHLKRKPCAECLSTDGTHAHHDDYAEPLNVRWLCAVCHRRWHAENGEGKNAQ
jgi:hypothetical protein